MGAGIGGFLLLPLLYGSGFLWPIAAFLAWILVLPRLTFAALALSLVSWGVYWGLSASELESFGNNISMYCTIALSIAAALTIPVALANRLVTLTAMTITRS